MWRVALALLLVCSACGARRVPTLAAFEVPLATAADREEFLVLLSREAQAQGFHVDASTPEELEQLSPPFRKTIDAAVWRGNDDEAVAFIMDSHEALGRPSLVFSETGQPERAAQFRESLMRKFRQRWPGTRSLPIMPTGGTPPQYQLKATQEGYKLRPEYASEYQISRDSHLVARE